MRENYTSVERGGSHPRRPQIRARRSTLEIRRGVILDVLPDASFYPLRRQRVPVDIPSGAPTLVIRKQAFDQSSLTRAAVDRWLNLTTDEFRVEGELAVIGPLPGEEGLTDLIDELEAAGLVYVDDFFELSGNWSEWLKLYAMGSTSSDSSRWSTGRS